MKEKCKGCEKYILSECKGVDENIPDIQIEVCYLEDIYNLAADRYLEIQRGAYSKRPMDWTEEEAKAAYLRDVVGTDVRMLGVNSPLYPMWNLDRCISTIYCLEIYRMLDVKLTLNDFRGESFYAGMPKATPEDIRKTKKYLQTI
jgi:hypothetical protein